MFEEMSLEELIENVQDAAILGKRDSVFVKGIKNRFAELQQKLENARCCGNCDKFFFSKTDGFYCGRNSMKHPRPNKYCILYQPDQLTQKERE